MTRPMTYSVFVSCERLGLKNEVLAGNIYLGLYNQVYPIYNASIIAADITLTTVVK